MQDLVTAAAEDIEIVFLYDSLHWREVYSPSLLAALGRSVDIADSAAAVHALQNDKLDGITTFSESQLERTSQLAARLGLRFHHLKTAVRLRHKYLQRCALRRRGLATPPFAMISRHSTLPNDLPMPCVVKPIRGEGSQSVQFFTARQDLQAFVHSLSADDRYVVEKMMSDASRRDPEWLASYVSVETVTKDGRDHHWGITDRLPLAPPLRETGAVAPSQLRRDLLGRLTELTSEALRALGVRDGVLHTEVKLTPDGPMIIEVNGRLGGFMGMLYRLIGVGDLVRAAFDVALDLDRPLFGKQPHGVAAIAIHYPDMIDSKHFNRAQEAIMDDPLRVALERNRRSDLEVFADAALGTEGRGLTAFFHGEDVGAIHRSLIKGEFHGIK